ncbi:MAG: hypothetical protein ACLRZ9_02460 [Eubacterium sp.]
MVLILIFCPFINIFHPTNIDDIHKVDSSDSYVNVTADTLHYTGYNLIKTSGTNYGYYYALKNDHCIFAIIPIDNTPQTEIHNYTFKAKVMKPDRTYKKMLSAFSKDLNWNADGLSGVTLGFVLSNADYHPVLYMIFLWIVLLILLISIKKSFEAITCYVNPVMYPVCTFLGKHVQKELIDEAQEELSSDNYLQINSMYITENYFIDLDKSRISIIPLNEIVWCYRLGTMSLNPKVHEPEYSICFTILSGAVITAKHKTSDEALELINAIRATEYNIIIGHSDSKRKQAKKIIYNNKNH